jgi:hypothetical protein
MLTALYVTPETYRLYTEVMEDIDRIPLELEDVNYFQLLVDDNEGSPRISFMTPVLFEEYYQIIKPETETEFAVVTPK